MLEIKTYWYHIRKGRGLFSAFKETIKDFEALKAANNALDQGGRLASGQATNAEALFKEPIVENMERKVDEFAKRVLDE